MPLTKKLRQTYLDRAKHELGLKGGVVVDDKFFLSPKTPVTYYMGHNSYHKDWTKIGGEQIYYWNVKSFGTRQLYFVGDSSLFTQMKLESHYIVENFDPSNIHFITKEQSKFLHEYQLFKFELDPIQEWNDLVKHEKEHMQKCKDVKTRKNKVALDVDGEIKFSQLTGLFPGKSLCHLKSQIQIRNSCFARKPDCVFKIKPVYIDDACDPVYNRAEFEKCRQIQKENPTLKIIKPNMEN